QLFIHQPKTWLDWTFRGDRGSSQEVGGKFYDVLPFTPHRLAMVAGRVTGQGLPSALIMSALVMLFRTKMDPTSGAGQFLTELSADMVEILPDHLRIHIALVIIDLDR